MISPLLLSLALSAPGDDVTIFEGTLPLVISIPHGGSQSPPGTPNREAGSKLRDLYTMEFGLALRDAIALRTGGSPFLVASELHRSKFDPNRELEEASGGGVRATAAWMEYHAAIEALTSQATTIGSGNALYLDLHGHGHETPWIELGYGVSKAQLALPDEELSDSAWLRGPQSLGAFLQAAALQAVPSPDIPHADGRPYFNGGYSIRRHRGNGLRSIQIELPRSMREAKNRDTNVQAVADAVCAFLSAQFSIPRVDLEPRPLQPSNTSEDSAAATQPPQEVPADLQAFSSAFDSYTRPFGIPILATADLPQLKLEHATQVLAEYLDNNGDGIVDDPAVLSALLRRGAFLVMPNTEREMDEIGSHFEIWEEAGWTVGQDLYGEETLPNNPPHRAGSGRFDATLEEVWHLIANGWGFTYPEAFSYRPGSRLSNAMDLARGGQFKRIPKQYPAGSWYRYDDRTCDYGCQASEYFYWSLTSLLGGQSYPGRAEQIEDEWLCASPETLRALDPSVTALLEDRQFELPRRLPKGQYRPQPTEVDRD
jgi:hypothetical protein